jgi:hypothetical protein
MMVWSLEAIVMAQYFHACLCDRFFMLQSIFLHYEGCLPNCLDVNVSKMVEGSHRHTPSSTITGIQIIGLCFALYLPSMCYSACCLCLSVQGIERVPWISFCGWFVLCPLSVLLSFCNSVWGSFFFHTDSRSVLHQNVVWKILNSQQQRYTLWTWNFHATVLAFLYPAYMLVLIQHEELVLCGDKSCANSHHLFPVGD